MPQAKVNMNTMMTVLTLLAGRVWHVLAAARHFRVPAGWVYDPPDQLGVGAGLPVAGEHLDAVDLIADGRGIAVVVGQVTDHNTAAPVNGANVTSSAGPGQTATTEPEPGPQTAQTPQTRRAAQTHPPGRSNAP